MVCSERREDGPSSLKESAKATNFVELCQREVHRIPLLGTSVNKGDEAGPELLRPGPASCFLLILALGLAARTR